MKNKTLFILVLILLFSFSFKVSAQNTGLCLSKGYTVLTINGIFTDEHGADVNRRALERKLLSPYNGEKLSVDFLYNPTHLLGVLDIVDVLKQMVIDDNSDYDMVEVLNDASQKVTTQKLLLVGHSQGNFYANNLYDTIASKPGGVPKQSIGVYGVATPASRVAGGGKYLTSSSDKVIGSLIAKIVTHKILPSNINFPLQSIANGNNGHSFSDTYLKYAGNRIISDIKSSLNKLQNNDEQLPQDPCISPPEITALHKVQGVALNSADFVINNTKKAVVYVANGIYKTTLAIKNTIKGLFANAIESLPDVGSITTLPDFSSPVKDDPSPSSSQTEETTAEAIPPQETAAPPEATPLEGQLPVADVIFNTVIHGGGGSGGDLIPETEPTPDPIPEPEPDPVVIPPAEPEPPVVLPVPDTIAPVITLLGNSSEVITKNSTYTDAGATALDNIDGDLTSSIVKGGTFTDTATIGEYTITYTSTDIAGNISTATRAITIATYKYISKYSFGKNNGDGKNWQVWSFNGSNVYDWSDTYVDNYLREQFKIQVNAGSNWCSQCLQRGIFNHDPQEGFETADLISKTSLENSPQNNMNGITYDVVLQWDSTGYDYTISHGSIVDASGHTNVPNMNNDLWVGWDGSYNNFQTFPSGNWQEIVPNSPLNRTGGSDMVLPPFSVYKNESISTVSTLSLPNKGSHTVGGINPTRGRTNLTPFTFQIIFTDPNNNAPQNVKLHTTNITTGDSLSDTEMQKISSSSDVFSDGDFINGEAYITDNILYDTGDYDYYFTADDDAGNSIRIPVNEDENLSFETIPSTYTYIPKYSFGTNNGDGKDWQVWAFTGSNIYDWSDTYVNKYLKEQFKIQTQQSGMYCGLCLERGIFNHDPQKGFELVDRIVSSLENSPQNRMNSTIYDVVIQWDSTGYTYTISHNNITDSTGHTNISNVDENMWVGWDGSYNHFQTFPSGSWYDLAATSPPNRTGGFDMILKPYQVYDSSQVSTEPTPDPIPDPIPEPEPDPIPDPEPDPEPPPPPEVIPDNTPVPLITGYTFNGTASNITANPTVTNPLSLVINTSENVDWVSVKIERESDHTFYKIFQDGAGCVDNTKICTKSWNGLLSSGGLLQNGVYKIKLHIKDLTTGADKFYDYLSPYVITVDTSL